jgi:hypothetical protein
MKQLQRRLSKLEALVAASAKAEMKSKIESFLQDFDERIGDFLTKAETDLFYDLLEEVKSLEQLQAHPAFTEITLRSTTRRNRYRRLWRSSDKNRSHVVVAEPWSAEAEIEALRSEIAMRWERMGLALVLDELTLDDLTIFDRLVPARWFSIVRFAKPDELETVLARVQLDGRAASNERNEAGFPLKWEELHRPLTLADLNLDPETYPWWYRRQREQAYPGRASSWWRSDQNGPKPGRQEQGRKESSAQREGSEARLNAPPPSDKGRR